MDGRTSKPLLPPLSPFLSSKKKKNLEELMILEGDTRYVHAAELRAAGGRAKWLAQFAPGRTWGDRLRARPVAVVLGEGGCRTLFAHAGLHSAFLPPAPAAADGAEPAAEAASAALDALNAAASAAIGSWQTRGVLGKDGPLWNRFFSMERDEKVCPALKKTLAALGARRMVVGHTVR